MTGPTYLVNYGQAAYPRPVPGRGRVSAATTASSFEPHRGIELGTILGEAGPRRPGAGRRSRPSATPPTMRPLAGSPRPGRGDPRRCPVPRRFAAACRCSFLDGEILLDGREAILQAVHWAECDATPLFEQLSARHGLARQARRPDHRSRSPRPRAATPAGPRSPAATRAAPAAAVRPARAPRAPSSRPMS